MKINLEQLKIQLEQEKKKELTDQRGRYEKMIEDLRGEIDRAAMNAENAGRN
jgi:hypothetical protein